MLEFRYERAGDAAGAIALAAGRPEARYLGGGTNLVDLMRETIERPELLVDVTALSGDIVEEAGGIRIGAAAKNTAVAEHRLIRTRYPALARAILSGASGQIRNMATVGGNVLQRTRCLYFYDETARCNKRAPGAGCDAIEGFNRYHAILGASPACVATHPSDMAVALAALDAEVELRDGDGETRRVALTDLYRLPGGRPDLETMLRPGELVIAVLLPESRVAAHSIYRKVRDRSSYAFALISVAAALRIQDGIVADVRVALGGVAARPWRARAAEAMLTGGPTTAAAFRAAADAELADAAPLRDNGFKIELAARTVTAVLQELAGL